MTASQWLVLVRAAANVHFSSCPFHLQIIRRTRIKIRIEIDTDIFADLFFREETGRIDYTLIVSRRRRYGMDNLNGWHEHPVHEPDLHVPISEPSPEQALHRLREAANLFMP